MRIPSADAHLAVATPERVVLSLPVAGIGFRALAYLLDVGLLFATCATLFFASSFLGNAVDAFRALVPWAQTVAVVALFAIQWVYWTACEVAFEGQTLGKRWMRIRVIRDDGSPVGLYESAVRNLCRAVDFLPAFYAVGVVSMLLSRGHRRVGDFAAGTLLVRVEQVSLDKYAQDTAPAAHLGAAEHELVLDFLRRAESLEPSARGQLAVALAGRLGAHPESPQAAESFLRALASGAAHG